MIELCVITVPAPDIDNPGGLHIAYMVYESSSGVLRASAGWTLRDAIEFFARDYCVRRGDVKIARPFVQQEIYLRGHEYKM